MSFKQFKNKLLCKCFRFLYNKDEWIINDNSDFDMTILDLWKTGWRKRFGIKFIIELKIALKKDKLYDEFYFDKVKVTSSTIKFYYSLHGHNTDRVIRKYENNIYLYCCVCGRDSKVMSNNPVAYYCNRCYDKKYIKKTRW